MLHTLKDFKKKVFKSFKYLFQNFFFRFGLAFGLNKLQVNLEMTIIRLELDSEIPICVRNWELKTWGLKPRFENPDS